MPHVFADNTGEPEGEVYGSVSTRQGKSISNRVHSANDWRCPCSSLVRKAEADVTKTYEWRIDQLDRLTRMLKDNYERFVDASRKDFKTAAQENVFEVSASIATSEFAKSQLEEWMRPVEAPLLKFLAASGGSTLGVTVEGRGASPSATSNSFRKRVRATAFHSSTQECELQIGTTRRLSRT